MKKAGLIFVLSILTILTLGACSSVKSVDLTDYIEVSFDGMDTVGYANYYVDDYEAVVDRSGFKPEDFETEMIKLVEKKPEKAEEINALFSQYNVSIDKEENLSNGDKVKVTVTVDEDAKGVKGGEKEFTVEGLEEPEELTAEDVKKHIIVDFVGANERGSARIENTFNDDLAYIDFTVENNGELTNGDEAILTINEEETSLIENGFKLAEDFNVTYEVKGLHEFAAKAEDISNIQDVKRMITEEVNKAYPKESDWNFSTVYDVNEEVALYRQFNDEDEDSYSSETEQHGSFVVLYTIKEYDNMDSKKEKDVYDEYVVMQGYRNLELDDNGKVNVSKMIEISDTQDSSYSLDTVQQIYEGNGYEVAKIKDKKAKK